MVDMLAKQLVASFGAPTIADARAAAEEEVAFVESLCTQPGDTLIAVHRTFEEGAVRESFRTLRPRKRCETSPRLLLLWRSMARSESDTPNDEVKLVSMAERERK